MTTTGPTDRPNPSLAALGLALVRGGLHPRRLSAAWSTPIAGHAAARAGSGRWPVPPGPAGAALRCWVEGATVARAELVAAGVPVAAAIGAGLLAPTGPAEVEATVTLLPVDGGLLAADRLDRQARVDAAAVPDDSSHHLAAAIGDDRVERWLDLGAGPAVLPLLRPGRATHVLGLELGARAVALGRIGLALSAARGVELTVADLCAHALPGVPPGRFERVTFNPPMPIGADGATAPGPGHRVSTRGERVIAAGLAHAGRACAVGGEVLVHLAWTRATRALVAALPGAVTALCYGEAAATFALLRWHPHRRGRAVREHTAALTPARPHLGRADLDAADATGAGST